MNCLASYADSGFQSPEVPAQANKIFGELEPTFAASTPDDNHHAPVYRALEVLVMIYHLPNIISPSMSYKVFQMVMQSCVPETCSKKKWKVSCLAIHNAYIDNQSPPGAKELKAILTFLSHYFDLGIADGKYQDVPIQNALHVLASTTSPTTIEAIKQLNPTGNWFVYGIRHTLQSDRAPELREAALLFLPLIADIWFHPSTIIMGSIEMDSFCTDWASAVDSVELTSATLKASLTVLFAMISSPLWRPHIVPDKWTLLKHFRSVPADLEPLNLCIKNPGLIDEIRHVDNHEAMVLWAEILWSNYAKLTLKIREQLVKITGEISGSERGTYLGTSESHIDKYLSNVDLELREAEEARMVGIPQQVDKVRMLKQAQVALGIIKQGGNPQRLLQAS